MINPKTTNSNEGLREKIMELIPIYVKEFTEKYRLSVTPKLEGEVLEAFITQLYNPKDKFEEILKDLLNTTIHIYAIDSKSGYSDGGFISTDHLPHELREHIKSKQSIEELEKGYILEILGRTGYNKSQAAKVLGIARKTLYEKIEKYNIECPTG